MPFEVAPTPESRRARALGGCALAFAISIVLFGGACRHGFTSWDDDHYVLRNPLIRDLSPAGIARIFTSFDFCNYHPLTTLSYAVDFALVGLDPRLYHVESVLLHGLVAALAYLLGRRYIRSDGAALVGALLFAVHPLRVESVAWVAERKGLLCSVFSLATVLLYSSSLDAGTSRRRAGLWWAALGAFVLALLSKVLAVALPLVLLAMLIHERRLERPRLAGLAPFLALSAAFGWIGLLAQRADDAVRGLHGGSVPSHLLTPFRALSFYAWKTLLPLPLSPRYALEAPAGFADASVICGIGLALAGAGAIAAAYRRRSPAFFLLSFAALAWAPVCGLLPTSTIVADRYTYLPSVGLALAGARAFTGARLRAVGLGIASGLILLWAWLTPARVEVWRDGPTLWADALRENPGNPLAHNHLSIESLAAGRYGEAIAPAIETIRVGFRAPPYLFNLCLAYRGFGDTGKEVETARGIVAGAPDFLPAWIVILHDLLERGDLDAYERCLERLEAEHRSDPALLAPRGDLAEARGDLAAALEWMVRSLEAVPDDPENLIRTASILSRTGHAEKAAPLVERAAGLQGCVLSRGALRRLGELRAR